MNLLSRIRSEPATAAAIYQQPQLLYSPVTPHTAAKTRDPNAPDYRYQVNQKCIYERELPGGSYITAHLQRLQSGYYDSAVVHEDLIENVRFIAINFVFHPSRKDYRFKSAEITVAIHHTAQDQLTPLDKVRNSVGIDPRTSHDHDHATQTDTVSNALVRSTDFLPAAHPKIKANSCRPKFIRHAPHLLFGSISPETLDWNFNLAGSIGVSQGPVNAAFKPSYGTKGSYKIYEMMRIQGSVRTLRSWYGHEYDVEDGEVVWTLEENSLQKSGLPREFTFVMLLTKGSGGFEPSDDVMLEVDIHPKVSGPLGGTYPKFVTGLHKFQPFLQERVNLDEEIGQVFEPCIRGRGFNFANLATNFDDFVWLPGTTYSTTDNPNGQQQQPSTAAPQPQSGQQQTQQPQLTHSQSQRRQSQITSQPTADTTLNLRVILENARGSPVPVTNGNQFNNVLPYLHLKPPSRNHSPLPPSVVGSHKSKRSITIKSQAPTSSEVHSRRKRHSYASPESRSRHASGGSMSSQPHARQVSHTHSLRKTRSRSGLDKEYIRSESPTETREAKTQNQTFHDARTGISDSSTNEQGSELATPVNAGRDEHADESGDKTPRFGDERELSYGGEEVLHVEPPEATHEQDTQQLRLPQEHEGDLTPASRYHRFPSLSQSYSRAEARRAGPVSEEANPPRQAVQTPPQTPPAAAASDLARPLEDAQTPRSRSVPEEQAELEADPEPRSSTPPPIQGRDFVPSTPPSNQLPAVDSPKEPTLEPSTMLDNRDLPKHQQYKQEEDVSPSTPSWHQHSSSLSPPSALVIINSSSGPVNATPRFKRPQQDPTDVTPTRQSTSNRQSQDHPETSNWNDTPPEWASPSGSGSNTPTRNRSIRTRKATARALALQDQLTSASHGVGPGSVRGSDEYYRTPNVTVPGQARSHSLKIQAGPQARAYSDREENLPQSTATGTDIESRIDRAKAGRYTYPSVPQSTSGTRGVTAQSLSKALPPPPSQPEASQNNSSGSLARKPAPPGKEYNFNYTRTLLQEQEYRRDHDLHSERSSGYEPGQEHEQEYPPQYADASRSTTTQGQVSGQAQAQGQSRQYPQYTREQLRQLAEMERESSEQGSAKESSQNPSTSQQISSAAKSQPDAVDAARDSGATDIDPQPMDMDMDMDSPTLPTHATMPTKSSTSAPRRVSRDRAMPPVTNIRTSSQQGSNTSTRKNSKDMSPITTVPTGSSSKSNKSNTKKHRESLSLLAKAQKYMREAGYGSWTGGNDSAGESDDTGRDQRHGSGSRATPGEKSFEVTSRPQEYKYSPPEKGFEVTSPRQEYPPRGNAAQRAYDEATARQMQQYSPRAASAERPPEYPATSGQQEYEQDQLHPQAADPKGQGSDPGEERPFSQHSVQSRDTWASGKNWRETAGFATNMI